jgi:2-phosphosulfolactate phosphatase
MSTPRQTVPVEVIALPRDLLPHQVEGRAVAVFDVLRATTSMTAALAAGVKEIRVFGDVQSAADAAAVYGERRLLCGETRCLPPPGFDLGNSPAAFKRELHEGRTAFLSTTNGTRAVIAARNAAALFVGAIVNASAVANRLIETRRDVTLLCAGTGGQIAMEDLLGAGAVLSEMIERGSAVPAGDVAEIALRLFQSSRGNLREALASAAGGRNVIAAGLAEDVDFCAALNSLEVVGHVHDDPLRVTL